MNTLIDQAFEKVIANSTLKADLNRYTETFTGVSVSITTKRGKYVNSYSHLQKNVTGLYNQVCRFVEANYDSKKHVLVLDVE